MTRRVHITRKATLDIARSFTWMVENISVEAAEAWRNGLKEATRSLSTMALKCPEAPEAEWGTVAAAAHTPRHFRTPEDLARTAAALDRAEQRLATSP